MMRVISTVIVAAKVWVHDVVKKMYSEVVLVIWGHSDTLSDSYMDVGYKVTSMFFVAKAELR